MAGWKDFREIAAWRLARELKLQVDVFLARPEIKKKFSLVDQLYDAARSGPSNIAEGFGKFGNKEFARYARMAKGSEVEVLNHLIDLHDQKLITDTSGTLVPSPWNQLEPLEPLGTPVQGSKSLRPSSLRSAHNA